MRRYTVSIDDHSFVIDVLETASDRFAVSVDGQTFEATLHADHDLPGSVISPEIPSSEARTGIPPPIAPLPAHPGSSSPAPRPGRGGPSGRAEILAAPNDAVVVEVAVAAGQPVGPGDALVRLDASG